MRTEYEFRNGTIVKCEYQEGFYDQKGNQYRNGWLMSDIDNGKIDIIMLPA